jgi:hypothetical protein
MSLHTALGTGRMEPTGLPEASTVKAAYSIPSPKSEHRFWNQFQYALMDAVFMCDAGTNTNWHRYVHPRANPTLDKVIQYVHGMAKCPHTLGGRNERRIRRTPSCEEGRLPSTQFYEYFGWAHPYLD